MAKANENILKSAPSYVRADFQLSSINEERQTIDVVFATDTPVKRYDWQRDRMYHEVLEVSSTAMKMERLLAGAPVLDSHNRWSLDTQIGVVENARIENGQAVATLRISKRDERIRGLWEDIKTGIIRNISVGYDTHTVRIEENKDTNTLPVYRAISWTPKEISFVTVPADPRSGVRSESDYQFINIVNQRQMEPENGTLDPQEGIRAAGGPAPAPAPAPAPPAPAAPAPQSGPSAEEIRAAERNRIRQIETAVRAANLSDEFARSLIDGGTPYEQASTRILEEMARIQTATAPAPNPHISTGTTGDERFREDAIAGLIVRTGALSIPEQDKAGIDSKKRSETVKFQRMSLEGLARMCLERAGDRNIPYDRDELFKRAITSHTSDFAILLEGTARRTLNSAFQATPFDWDQWCSVGSVGDFRKYERIDAHANFNRLAKIEENAEYETFKINDGEKQFVQVFTFGKKFNLSRRMLINDDLNAFTRLIGAFGRAAQRSIQIDAYSLLVSNNGMGPVLSDGKTLFHADHGNITSTEATGPFSIDRWENMRIQMATTKPFGPGDVKDFLNIRPDILLCDIKLGMAAKLLNGEVNDPFASSRDFKKNPVAKLFNTILDTPWLEGAAYYAFANPAEIPVFEVSFLNGIQEPFMESRQNWDTDGIEYKCRMEYGVSGVGYKGAIRNAGVVSGS